MTRMTGPDCVVMCNLINTHTHTHTHTQELDDNRHKHIHTLYIQITCSTPEAFLFEEEMSTLDSPSIAGGVGGLARLYFELNDIL